MTDADNNPVEDHRLFPSIDRYLIGFLVLQLVAFALIPALPLGIAAAALATPLRRSTARMIALWAVGAVLTLVVIAPVVIGFFDLQLVEEGPVRTVTP